jgi:hypothetical protein
MANAEQRWVVDAIEESTASIEVDGETMITVPRALLPAGTMQGHVLRVSREASDDARQSHVTIRLDEAETKKALDASAAQVAKGRAESKKRDPGGDIEL